MTSNVSIPVCNESKHEIIFIRQESRVQVIHPDDEHEPFLKTTSPKQCRKLTSLKENEKDNEINTTKELKVNGNVVIYMPPKDEPCAENMKYQNERGLVTPVSFDHVDGPQFPKKKSASKCSCLKQVFSRPQTYVNIALALACAIALLVGVWSFVKNTFDNDDTSDKYLYCYSCSSTTNIKEKYRKGNMCCIKEPIQNFKDQQNSVGDGLGSQGKQSYNGSRILEFEADFQTNLTNKFISWNPSSNINNSFISHQSDKGHLTLTHDGTYVITVSLTTNTFSANTDTKYIRIIVCLVFETHEGEKTEECRPITHTEIMTIPFQIIKYRELQNGTKIYATISKLGVLHNQESHNKLFIVML
ncbi:uncharacterized protein LOC127738542 [Mytilus californianus]|uniref:uncharacterized protein LOC127738542 n=1 Tax=Mytilus californianus TaxID=6549 RepID=UPI0022470358|nr:uncharacterized protein LOC127738542 [Mytilus californianus]